MIFTTGAATDTVAPNILTVAPPDSSTNIGTNAGVSVNFDKAVNPVSVNGSSIQLSGGSITEVPSSISFTPDYLRTIIVPQAPLPGSTQMAIAIKRRHQRRRNASRQPDHQLHHHGGRRFHRPVRGQLQRPERPRR